MRNRPRPETTEPVHSPYDTAVKLAALAGVLLTIPGGVSLLICSELSQKEELAAIFSHSADHVTYRLEGAHIVAAEYGSARYAFNFKDNTVFATWPGDDRPGGGLTSFRGIDNPARADETRAQGCLIAAQVAKAVNPGHYTADTFPLKQEQAAAFTRTYCPQIP